MDNFNNYGFNPHNMPSDIDSNNGTTYNSSGVNGYYGNQQINQNNPYNPSAPIYKESQPAKAKKKGPSAFSKIALSLGCGIVFGLFAGLSFLVIKEVGNIIGLAGTQVENTVEEDDDAGEALITVIPKVKDAEEVDYNTQYISTNVVTDVSSVVEKVMPSIVSITNSFTYNYYYYSQPVDSKGSGIIIGSNDEELLIVTNYHVIDKNESLSVTFCDDTTVPVSVKGTDSTMDLAILAANYSDISEDTRNTIKVATMGDSNALKVGEPAIAIGNALGYGQSVTFGVVSAINREMDMDGNGELRTFIQTDAAINEGNSGGALLNINGDVVGINSNKLGGSLVEGMGYAIPITAAQPIIEELMTKQTRKLVDDEDRAYLGISGATVSTQEAAFYGYPDGVYVSSVYKGSAADEAGIEKGDFIVSFDGTAVSSMEQLQRLMKYYSTGETVEVGIYRKSFSGYDEKKLTIILGSRDDIDG